MSFPDPQARIASLERELAWAHLKIQSLVEELRQFRVKMLGPKSETLNDLQLELLAEQEPGATLDEVEAESQRGPLTVAPPHERKPHPGRQRLPEHLERVEEVVPCAEQTCRQCGAETAVIGYDESEQLDGDETCTRRGTRDMPHCRPKHIRTQMFYRTDSGGRRTRWAKLDDQSGPCLMSEHTGIPLLHALQQDLS